MKLKSLIGDKAFYKKTLAIAVPMIIQNAVTNLVNLLDNVMVGALGTESMSGVAIVNQFVFIFNLAIFGAVSAAGIFTAQYNGRGDHEGIRYTMRVKLMISAVIAVLGCLIFAFFGGSLISTFLHEGTEGNLEVTLAEGEKYLIYVIIGLVPYALSQVYASTLRETGETFVPMISSVVSVATNFVLNALLIFGMLGMPRLGVIGAAIATSVSRFIELIILVVWAHKNTAKCPFMLGLFKSLYVPRALAKEIAKKGLPILCNEFLWSLSVTVKDQCFSTRGLEVVAAQNIAFSLTNLLSVCYFALSSAVAIMVGNLLGAGELEQARDTDRKLLAFTVFSGFSMMLFEFALAPIFPLLYNTTESVRGLATYMMIVSGISMPFAALATASYYTIRSGGKVFITMLFDSVYAWCIVVPTAALLAYFTNISIYWLMPLVFVAENLKLAPGLVLVERGIWVKQLKINEN